MDEETKGLPGDATVRKGMPVFSGLICYFPHALAAVSELSRIGNDQHNPGQPLHWAKEKSTDETDCIVRHLIDFAVDPKHRDPDGVLAAVKIAWRALANLERLYDSGENIYAVKPFKELIRESLERHYQESGNKQAFAPLYTPLYTMPEAWDRSCDHQ